MQYCQTLKSSQRENQSKTLHPVQKGKLDLERNSESIGKGLIDSRNQNEEWEGKRLIRKREVWEDHIEMGIVRPDESFKVKETQKIRRDYLKELMYNEVRKNGMKFRAKFLSRHKVSSEVRVRMVRY